MTPEPNDPAVAPTMVVRDAPPRDPVPLSERVRERVQARIRAFVEGGGDDPAGLREAARALDLLPLEATGDGGRWLGVRPTADVVSFAPGAPHDVAEVEDPWRRAAALARASERYPELDDLVPPAPLSARVCPRCLGAGRIRLGGRDVPCVCGGLGWIPPVSDAPAREGEQRVARRSRRKREG